MSEEVKQIEDKIKELQTDISNKSAYLASINEAIKKLRADRRTVQAGIHASNGAVEAYSSSASLFKKKTGVLEGEIVKE